jgi:hypothetical protein
VSGWSCDLEERGLTTIMQVLMAEDKKALAILRKHLRGIGQDLASAASARFPGGGAYQVRLGLKGLTVSARGGGGRTSRSDWSDRGVLTSILESFGAKSAKPRARACLATLNARYGTPGRFLNAAWKEGKPGYRLRAELAAREAESALDARLKAAGVGE